MLTFVVVFALAQIAATVLASGVGHLVRLGSFRALVREHGLVSRGWAAPVALGVLALELLAGGAALTALLAGASPGEQALLFAACAGLGGAFTVYVRALLRRPVRAGSCGCSPVASPLTPASLVPSVALLAVSLAGAGATLLGPDAAPPAGASSTEPLAPFLASLWGLTLAGLQFLYPAAIPAAVGRAHP
jgi:hypothetical protein